MLLGGAHGKLDKVRRVVVPTQTPANFDLVAPLLLLFVVRHSGSRLLANYFNVYGCETFINSEPLRNTLLDGSQP